MSIKKGSFVKQVITPISGEVISKRFNEDEDAFEFLVTFMGQDEHVVEVWFKESQLQEVVSQ